MTQSPKSAGGAAPRSTQLTGRQPAWPSSCSRPAPPCMRGQESAHPSSCSSCGLQRPATVFNATQAHSWALCNGLLAFETSLSAARCSLLSFPPVSLFAVKQHPFCGVTACQLPMCQSTLSVSWPFSPVHGPASMKRPLCPAHVQHIKDILLTMLQR